MSVTYEQINIGDEIYFEMPYVKNHDLYWTVKSKNDNKPISLELDAMGVKDSITIETKYIKIHKPI